MAEDSTFNAEQFVGIATDQAGETKFYPVPVGEYLAQIDKVEARGGIDKNGNPWRALDISWAILDDGVKAELQMEKPTARQNIFVNVTPQGGLDWGRNKNIALGRLREAVGQNRPGRAWSPTHLMGQMAKVNVIHVPDQNGDPRAEVNKVASA